MKNEEGRIKKSRTKNKDEKSKHEVRKTDNESKQIEILHTKFYYYYLHSIWYLFHNSLFLF